MGEYLFDFAVVTILIVGITAVMGVLTNGIGISLFGRGKKNEFVDQIAGNQKGWKQIGGKRK
ncbi:hypothetical protein A8F94_16195 [Bacillus sp. FJAT-27225]|uniref:hypothetical protein n=1 Tax=Bacillus sp. FJAT-27225 TaxID=1743144 RepID=UPI00080C209D|nr:hypothetical protein [Bacillus sp. FJAT-27225]OCA84255.1 hypothetical protein A8F94_16195 [Bacillus sp. FJAT-27225]